MNASKPSFDDMAKQLIGCERELLTLRRRQARLSAWLDLAHKLAKFVIPGEEMWRSCTNVSREILASLELQKAIFLEVQPQGDGVERRLRLKPIVDPRRALAPFDLSEADTAIVTKSMAGMCSDSSELPSLAEPLKVHRFMWYCMDYLGAHWLVFVAGYDAERAPLYVPFDSGDFGHFRNTGGQLALLFGNTALAREVAREQEALRSLNVQLEQRVTERTAELRRANDELNATMTDLREKKRLLAEDIEQARLFQERILAQLPVCPEIEFGVLYRPLEQVGGDIYDVCQVSSGHYRVFLADATGHGVQASMRTILLKTEYDRIKRLHLDPGRTLHELTCRLFELFPDGDIMCTGACIDLVLDAAGAMVSFANAANPSLLHLSHDGFHEMHHEGSFLGLDQSDWPNPTEFRMAPGDRLLIFTDGLTEQTNRQGELFEQCLQACVGSAWPTAADGIRRIDEEFAAFVGGVPVTDDVTAIAIRLP